MTLCRVGLTVGVCVPMGCGTLCRVGLTLGVCVPMDSWSVGPPRSIGLVSSIVFAKFIETMLIETLWSVVIIASYQSITWHLCDNVLHTEATISSL